MRLFAFACVLGGTLISATASAAPTLLTSLTKDYGIGPDKVSAPSLGANSCDTLHADYVNITDNSSGCNRFYDVFDFSFLDYDSVDRFELTLNYSSTDDKFIIFNESWHVRADSEANGQEHQVALVRSGGLISSLFTIGESDSIFDDILNAEKFYFWFAEEALGSNNFNLYSASLDIFGEAAPTPEPETLSLFGISLLGLYAMRRRYQLQLPKAI